MCKKEHVHVAAESTEAVPEQHWHSLSSISMLDLTLLLVRLPPLRRGAPVSAAAAVTNRDKRHCRQGADEKLRTGEESERARQKGEREGRGGGGGVGHLMKCTSEISCD